MGCQLLRTSFKLFRNQIAVVASALSRVEIIHCFSRSNFDVALISSDLGDGPLVGLQVLQELHASHPQTPVVILFDLWRDDLIVHAFRAGAKGVFCRTEPFEKLSKCIQAVSKGQVWANSDQLQLLLKALMDAAPVRGLGAPGLGSLPKREAQVASLVAEGLPNKEIGLKLGISEHTVSNYLFRIYNKLGVSSRVELALYATRLRAGKTS